MYVFVDYLFDCVTDIHNFACFKCDMVSLEIVEGQLLLKTKSVNTWTAECFRTVSYLDFFLGTYDGKQLPETVTVSWTSC
jgi:hypothetical protein